VRVAVRRGLTAPELVVGLQNRVSALHPAAPPRLGHSTSLQLSLWALWKLLDLLPPGQAFLQNHGDHKYIFPQAENHVTPGARILATRL